MEERKRIRKERKLQKIAAYLNMAELNEQDRKVKYISHLIFLELLMFLD